MTRGVPHLNTDGYGGPGIEPEPLPERVALTRSRAGLARARTASPAASAGEIEQRDGDGQLTPDVAPMDVDAAASVGDALTSGDSSSSDNATGEVEPAAATAAPGAVAEPLSDAASVEGPSVDGNGIVAAAGPAETVTSPTGANDAAAPTTPNGAAAPVEEPPKAPTPAPLDGAPFVREDSQAMLEWLVRNTSAWDMDQLWAFYVDLSNTVADRFRDGKMTSMKERWQDVLMAHQRWNGHRTYDD